MKIQTLPWPCLARIIETTRGEMTSEKKIDDYMMNDICNAVDLSNASSNII